MRPWLDAAAALTAQWQAPEIVHVRPCSMPSNAPLRTWTGPASDGCTEAADAAMRWGVGAGAARVASGTMTLHRRLEERLADFTRRRSALLFGSGSLANLGVIPALARRGEVVLHDELSHASIRDGCQLSGADVVAYRHGDADHLAWALRQADGRAALICTDGMFGMDGDVAPLAEIVE